MGRNEDRYLSGHDDLAAVLSLVDGITRRIAGCTTNPVILREVEELKAAIKRGRNYLDNLRRLREIEAQARR